MIVVSDASPLNYLIQIGAVICSRPCLDGSSSRRPCSANSGIHTAPAPVSAWA